MTDWFYDLLPLSITYGMSTKEFWEGSPDLFWAYRFSYYERQRNEQELLNYNAWLQGAYFYEAVSVALANSLGKQKYNYASKPYSLTEEEQQEEFKKKRKELETRIKNRISEMQKIKGESTNKGEEEEVKVDGRKANT